MAVLSFFFFSSPHPFLVSGQFPSLYLLIHPNTQAQGWEMKHIGNVKHLFFVWFFIGGVDMQQQFTRTVNTCI